MRWVRSGAIACIAATAVPAWAAGPADSLIQSSLAVRTATYQGVVLYRGDESFDVLRVEHRYKNDSERERIVSLTGEPRQLLRIDDRVISIQPKGRAVSLDRPSLKGVISDITAERIDKLSRYYDFRDLGTGRIAGRGCSGVGIVPKDALRYGYEIWLDDERHLPLKVSLLGPRNEVLEQVMFTEVSFPATIPDEAFETEVDTSKFSMVARNLPPRGSSDQPPPPASADSVVKVERLPPGFEVVGRDERTTPDGQGRVEHLMLSDGLSSVSVFTAQQQVTESAHPFRGVSHLGPVQAYGRTVGQVHITIVGEVPIQTIKLIGDGLQARLPGPVTAAPPAPAALPPSGVLPPS